MGAEGVAAARASAIQRYRFVRRLAVGGMAEIYVADAIGVAGVQKRVALKRVLPSLANDVAFVTMFLREARIASTLQHPNIVQTYDVIDSGGEYTIAMELLEGMDLLELRQRLFQRQRAPTPAQVLYVLDRILSGLHYAHERQTPDGRPMNLVHRDLSPHNVFLTRDGNVKLLDFGVAKVEAAFGREVTESGVVKGKVLYMSPEQCQGLEVDRTSDIYAAGVLAYILLTGRHPFRGANPYDTMRAVIHDTPPPPSSVVPSLGPAIDEIVMRAMEKNPAKRFRTAREMQQALAVVVRQRGWFVTDLDFAAFVESLTDPEPPEPDTRNLPDDLVIGDLVPEEPVEHDERIHSRADHIVAETEHALLERVRGLTLLTLRGAIDERFDPSIARHLRGVVLVDTEDVTRITSYGIRALLEVIETSAPVVDAVFHLRCSVAFIQQVNMIRRLLAGGKVVSFHLPYVDPVTDQSFRQTVSGHHAALILRARQPPPAPCPGHPDRLAEFDEDPESYLDFADDFCADPPAHVRYVIDALAVKEKRRQVEKEITADGLVIYIRRPIDDAFRWRALLAGVEGAVKIDLDATPTWTDPGLERLVAAMAAEAHSVTSLEATHMPVDLYERIRKNPKLAPLIRGGSVRVHALCPHCGAPRRMAVDVGALTEVRSGPVRAPCPTCGEPLDVLRALSEPEPGSRESKPVPRGSRRVRWAVAVSGLVLMTIAAAVLVALGLQLRP